MIVRKEKLIILATSLALSFLLYGNSINGDFVSDDKLIILQNPLVKGNPLDLVKAFSNPYYYNQPHAGLYRPLTIASYNLNRVFDSGHFSFHLVNIFLNAINGFLVFLLVHRLINKGIVAYIAMILFMFLPIHSEVVSANVGRAELLSFLFSVVSLLMVLDKKYARASIMLLLGLLSKETAAGFFLIFLYLWKFREHKTIKQIIYNSLYIIPSVAIYAIMRVSVLGKYFAGVDHLMAYNPLKFVSFSQSLWTSFKVFYLYILKTIAPLQLSSDYSFNQISVIKNPFVHYEVFIGVAILVGLIYLAVKKRDNIYGLSAAIFLLTYFLVSNWVIKIGTIMGERLMYAPSLGLVILIAVAVESLRLKVESYSLTCLPAGRNLKFSILHFLLLTLFVWYGYVIIDRNRDWRNENTIITSGYAASPNSVVSLTSMAFLDFNDKNYSGASRWAEKALEIFPDHLPALFLAGHAYKNSGDFKSAETYWLKVVEINSNYVEVYLSLGVLYYEQGRLDKAEIMLGEGFRIEGSWGKAFPLALVKTNMGKYDEAIKLVIDNFGADPQKRELKFILGLAYLKKGDKIKAEYYLSQIKDPNVSIEDYFKKVINQKVFKISEY